MNNFIKKNKHKKFVILDIPLLMENKINNKNDVLIFVESSKIKILARLKKRSNYNREVLKNLIENQVKISKKKRLANYIVDNNFSPNIMKKKIKLLRTKILNERNSTRYWNYRTFSKRWS